MADKIVVLNDGRVEQIGTPLELFDYPANVFVASFIGSPAMNLITGTVENGDFVDHTGSSWALGRPELNGRAVVYGVRPEHLQLVDAGAEAVVSVVEPTGSETHMLLNLGERTLAFVLRDRTTLRVGDRVHLRADASQTHLFDAESGLRL